MRLAEQFADLLLSGSLKNALIGDRNLFSQRLNSGSIDSSNALCIRTRHGSALLAVGPEGIRPLPDEIPTLWVTAPNEQAKVGFAINGGFILDAGRGELATRADSGKKSRQLARQIGIQAGEVMGKLLADIEQTGRSFARIWGSRYTGCA